MEENVTQNPQAGRNAKRAFYFADAGIGFLFILLTIFLASLVAAIVMLPSLLASSLEEGAVEVMTDSKSIIISSIVTQACFIAFYFIFCQSKGIGFKEGGLHRAKPLLCLTVIALTIACLFFFGFIANLWDELIALMGYKTANPLADVEINSSNVVWFIIAIGILPGIGEELIFRGVLLKTLNSRYSEAFSVLLSAALFAVFHMSPDQTVYQFFLGIILGYVTLRTGSILPAMIMHATNNSFSILMIILNFTLWPTMHIVLLFVVAVVLLPIGYILITYLIDRLNGTLYKNYFFAKLTFEKRTSGGLGLYLRTKYDSDVDMTEKRYSYLEEQEKKRDEIEPPFMPPNEPFYTGNLEYDAITKHQYEELKRGLFARRKTAHKRSKILLLACTLFCTIVWVVTFINGFTIT